MPRLAKKRTSAPSTPPVAPAKTAQPSASDTKKLAPISKQSRVIAMLQSPGGATIAAMMKVTGWQQHSVRGFLAGVVSRRLKLKLASNKTGDSRVYRIVGEEGESGSRRTKRHSF